MNDNDIPECDQCGWSGHRAAGCPYDDAIDEGGGDGGPCLKCEGMGRVGMCNVCGTVVSDQDQGGGQG